MFGYSVWRDWWCFFCVGICRVYGFEYEPRHRAGGSTHLKNATGNAINHDRIARLHSLLAAADCAQQLRKRRVSVSQLSVIHKSHALLWLF
jgi:hypothetical protein